MSAPDPAENMDPLTATTITIKDVKLYTPSRWCQILPARRYYIRFSVGRTTRETSLAPEKRNITSWTDDLSFNVDGRSIVVEVHRKHCCSKKTSVSNATVTIEGRLNDRRTIKKDISNGSTVLGNIEFTVILGNDRNAGEPQVADIVARANETVQMFESTRSDLLKKISKLIEFISPVAEAVPGASRALKALSLAIQIPVNQANCDEHMVRLARTMTDVLTFVDDAGRFKVTNEHREDIERLIEELTTCGDFIVNHAKDKNFWTQMREYLCSNIDDEITKHEKKLENQQKALLNRITLQIGGAVIDRAMDEDLKDLPYASGAKYSPGKGCTKDTRVSLIGKIRGVLDNLANDAPQVCLLTGVAGCGKSAISHEIAKLYYKQGKLGSSYFFARNTDRNLQKLFGTIARDLADNDARFKSALCRIIRSSRALRDSTSLLDQLQHFIVEPSKGLHATVPLIIVIDGLDQSGDRSCRQKLLDALSDHIVEHNLPSHLRFLITARREHDIMEAFKTGRITRIKLEDAKDDSVDGDIRAFILYALRRQRAELESAWPQEDWCQRLVKESQRLFLWASTACGHIRSGYDRPRLLREVLRSSDTPFYPLDSLYHTILGEQFKQESDIDRFKKVMSVILTLKASLSLASLEALFDPTLRFPDIIKPLASLLDSGDDQDTPICLPHTSFEDFLLDRRSEPFFVDIDPNHQLSVGQQLLARMRDMLTFDMCNLKDTRLRNAVVPNLDHRVKKAIPPHLAYACLHWMNHLQKAECTPMVLKEVELFFKKSFLYWLEAISLLSLSTSEPIELAKQTCTQLSTWAQVSEGQEVAGLALDALWFIQVFDPVLRNSTFHLYLSAMPQTPTDSRLYKLWKDHPQNQFLVTSRQVADWSANDSTSNMPFVSSVVYSPDGKHIVSGFSDGSIRIWNASSGQCLRGPLKGHNNSVYSIAYSPNGESVVSGSADSTIRIWDMAKYQSVIDPMEHKSPVKFVVYSSTGEHIVSNSIDGTIKVWTATGQLLAGPFKEHTNSNSVAYSFDARHVVSGSWANSMEIWNAANGQCVTCPLQGDTISASLSIACSHDGKKIAFGPSNGASWNCAPLQGPQSVISSIANLSEGNKITSGSTDSSIKILDARSKCIAGPFQKYTSYVFSVYSPNGCCPAPGSDGHFIKIWKTQELPSLGYIHDQNGWLLSSSSSDWIAPWFRSTFYLPFHSFDTSPDNTCQPDIGTSST